MFLQRKPLPQNRIHPRLPPRTGGSQRGQHVGIDAQVDRHLGIGFHAAGRPAPADFVDPQQADAVECGASVTVRSMGCVVLQSMVKEAKR